MSDMKLIMERWDKFVLNEDFDACDTNFTVGDLVVATDIAKVIKDQEALKAKGEQLAKSPLKRFLKRGYELAKPLAKLGFGVGVAAAGAGGAAIAALAWASMADDTADLMGQLFAFGSKNEDNNAYRQFLETFCVDAQTLALIEDHYQKDYLEKSGIVKELKAYLGDESNATKPIPDITNHLVDWLNTKSAYKGSDDTQLVANTGQ